MSIKIIALRRIIILECEDNYDSLEIPKQEHGILLYEMKNNYNKALKWRKRINGILGITNLMLTPLQGLPLVILYKARSPYAYGIAPSGHHNSTKQNQP